VRAKGASGTALPGQREATGALFLQAYGRNWDDGITWFRKLLRHAALDRGTALLVYWLAHPEYYLRYECEDDVPAHEVPVFRLLRALEARVARGDLPEVVSYHPPAEGVAEAAGRLPSIMTTASAGVVSPEALIAGDSDAQRMLHACRTGDLGVVRELCARFDPNVPIGGAFKESPLSVAAAGPSAELLSLLLEHGGKLDSKVGPARCSLLHLAVWGHREASIRLLVDRGLPVDVRARWRRTPLHYALHQPESSYVETGSESIVRLLLELGADPSARDDEGLTPAALASQAGNPRGAAFVAAWKLRR
jgi:cytohesin